ncbi:nitroreductase [Diplocloster modestus]|uniref:Nitroreductase n=1 Tax=Diplocloster modestus TaxID=2850322 RepID=A0ABS6K9T8_9FIRM|nr:nitroreductase [Diplocloster modestus]MBU9727270.1 nitroreductase [Diplocloster modestus]
MSQVMDAILTRRSIRSYKPDMVPDELLDQIVEAGTYAATGMGAQSPIIAAVTNKNIRDRLSRMNAGIMGTGTDPFYGAPVVLVVLADRNRSTYLYDGSLVIGNMMLAAHDLGLGSCWIHRAKEEFDSPEGKALLKEWGIEGDYEGIGHCIVGYADGAEQAAKPRKSSYVYHVK